MKLRTFEIVMNKLNQAKVRYLVAGGLAVNAHGYQRFSADIDLVIALDSDNITQAFKALGELGYRPLVPITAEQFADPVMRQGWFDSKNMRVLSFFSDEHMATPVDVFIYAPFDFNTESAQALHGEVVAGLVAHFVSLPTLIRMKEAVGRPRDIDDVQHLRQVLEEQQRHE